MKQSILPATEQSYQASPLIYFSIKQVGVGFSDHAVSNKSHIPSSFSAPEAMEPPPADNVNTSTNETTPLLPKGAPG